MASQISFESFKRLLGDDVFVDYLNKFCSLPIFGHRMIYRKKTEKCVCEPHFLDNIPQLEALRWIWTNRLPFFFRSHIYAEYKLAKALIEYDLNEDGGVEPGLARGLERLQCHSFSKMSRFSKFCKFLSETGEGLKLVAFFIAAQHVFVAYYEGDPDSAVHIGELRDTFFDETSYWCLPNKVLQNYATSDQSTSVAFCMIVSQRVLSRICLYWLPRYLLHLRLTSMESKGTPDIDPARQYLHDLVFRIQNMDPETARRSVSVRGLTLLSQSPLTSNDVASEVAEDRFSVVESDFFPSNNVRRQDRRMTQQTEGAGVARTRSIASVAIPGADIKVERRKSKRPTMLQLSTAINFGTSMMSLTDKKNDKFEQIRQTRRVNKESRLETTGIAGNRLNERSMSKGMLRKASGLQNVNSVSGLTNRLTSVTKAVSKFKLAKDSKPALQSGKTSVGKASPPTNTKSDVSVFRKPKKFSKDDQGPITGPMKNVIKFKTADLLAAADKSIPLEKSKSERKEKEIKKEESTSSTSKSAAKVSDPSEVTASSTSESEEPARKTAGGGLGALMAARSVGLKWKKGLGRKKSEDIATKALNKLKPKKVETAKVEEKPESKGSGLKNATGLKMVFAMSDQRETQSDSDNKTIKVLTKKDNRLKEDVITEKEHEEQPVAENQTVPDNYLRNRRNAMPKIKPLKTLRKRPHSQLPTTAAAKQEQSKRSDQQQTTQHQASGKGEKNKQAVNFEKDIIGQKKAEFIRKALMVNTLQERIKAPETITASEQHHGYGDNYLSSIYSLHEDQVYRHEMRHLKAALRSDDFAAGPFMAYLTDARNDESGMFALCFWQEVERFREEFSGMQQGDLILTMDQIVTKYVLNDRGFEFIPGMREYGAFVLDIDIFSCLTFPWSLRLMQRKCMELLNKCWEDYIVFDTKEFYDSVNMLLQVENAIVLDNIANPIRSIFAEEIPPMPSNMPSGDDKKQEREGRETTCRESSSRIEQRRTTTANRLTARPTVQKRRSSARRSARATDQPDRTSLGYSPAEMKGKTRNEMFATAMARRAHRSYLLAEQTCRLTAKMPQPDKFLDDESDEEGFIKPKAPPIYLRSPKLDMKTLSLMSAKEYPSKNPQVKATRIVRATAKEKTPSYMKDTIRKNGVTLKRPMLRPKHLIDCLRDPVHLEFFRRFAKTYHFERSVRFWKAVEVMKHIDDPKIRQVKIRGIVNQFFAKGATTGVGVDGQVLRDIMRTPPEKVTVSMLISAQACVMKALEDTWGERYLSTFTDVKKSHAQKDRMDRTEIMKLAQSNGKMTSIWKVFYAFIKRSAKFISTMRRRELRREFELYLQTIGRDPTVYHKEGWTEISATSYDVHMNPDAVFHQKKQQGRYIIAELLINDFRFWCEVECYRSQAEHIQQKGDDGMYNAVDEEILHDKAKLICDQFLSSPIPPKCRINIQSELSATVIENVKLGMFNRSLFHDLTINIFPLLLNYWKIFCERRHKYVPRGELYRFKRELVLQRRAKNKNKAIKASKESTGKGTDPIADMSTRVRGDGPLIDYCKTNRFTNSWMDITKTMDETPVMNFSLAAGIKLSLPVHSNNNHSKQPIAKINSGEQLSFTRSKMARK